MVTDTAFIFAILVGVIRIEQQSQRQGQKHAEYRQYQQNANVDAQRQSFLRHPDKVCMASRCLPKYLQFEFGAIVLKDFHGNARCVRRHSKLCCFLVEN